jgi:hypothetical protein
VQANRTLTVSASLFDLEDFKAHEEAVVLVSTKEVVQPSFNSLLLDLWRFEFAHLAIALLPKPDPEVPQKFLSPIGISVMQYLWLRKLNVRQYEKSVPLLF